MSETKRFPLRPGCGPVYSKIYQLLTTTDDTRLTDEQVAAVAGVDCRVGSDGYGTVCRVIKKVESTGRVWRRERGTGSIRLLNDGEKVSCTGEIVGRTSRLVKRGAVIVGGVDMAKLTNEQKTKANAIAAQVGAIALLSTSGTRKKIEVRHGEAVANVSAVLQLMSASVGA